MPKKPRQPLPEPLRYLQPVVRWMSRLSPDEWNEDLDPSRLESALRERLRGLDVADAEDALEEDRELLKDWLESFDSNDHPGWWVLGALPRSGDVEDLLRPAELPPRGPEIDFETPTGWKVKALPFRLDLKKGKSIVSIGAVEGVSAELLQHELDHGVPPIVLIDPPGVKSSIETLDVAFGEVSGKKTVLKQTGRVSGKRIEYRLAVLGGLVLAVLNANDAEFDEGPFESKLHTLRLSWPV